MAKQTINIGTAPNTGTGDALRISFTKVNQNFAELYTAVEGIPTNTNQLTNGSGFITASALSGYALTSAIPTNTNQLTNGSGFITASALSGYALTSAIPTNTNQLTNGAGFITISSIPTIPSDVSDLTDNQGLLGGGGGSSDRLVNGDKTVILGSDGTLTLPPQAALLQTVEQISTAKIYRATNSIDATAIQEAKDNWIGAEAVFADVRDQDAQIIAPATRPWAGMPSYEAYPLIISYAPPVGVPPPPGSLRPAGQTSINAYLFWKELVSNIDIVSGDKTFSFENTGNLRVPGVVTSDDLLTLVSGGSTTFNSASVVADGDNGNVFVKTRDGNAGTDRTWTFQSDGKLRLPSGGDIVDSGGNSVLGGDAGLTIITPEEFQVPGVTTLAFTGDGVTIDRINEITTINIPGGSSEGLPTVTVSAEQGTTYKGLQVAYGGFHSNGDTDTRNVTKVVIHKPAVTTVDIADTSESDFFQVSGLGSSDVLAMFVVVGDNNGEKPVSDIQAFAEAVIDTVILGEGQEGVYNTVDQMKTLFYSNYENLAAAAGGLATNFEFYQNFVPTLNGGPTTVREGSGAVFEISDLGNGAYNPAGIPNPGINYLPGHKIKVLGTDLGGVTPDNDCIITVDTVIGETGSIFNWSVSGTAAGTVSALYRPVTGTNYQTGSGFTVSAVYKYETYVNTSNYGTGYVVGDVITLLGENITDGTTPENNLTITVTSTGVNGEAFGHIVSGTVPNLWGENSISDGGEDEYDTGNYIDSSFDDRIDYNDGETVTDGVVAFGTGSSYSFVYQDSIFGLFVTGNSSTTIGTSGSGPDSGSTIISGYIYGPDTAGQTFTNAVSHINIIGGDGVDGIRFSDGTTLESAEGVGRVKLRAPGNRRIEEVHGYKQVSVTERTVDREFTGVTLSPTLGFAWDVYISGTAYPDFYDYVLGFQFQGITMTLSINGVEYTVQPYISGSNIILYSFNNNQGSVPVSYSEGDAFTVRRFVGAEPIVWWSKNELPGGSEDFRGAVIDYHAFTGESTIIGTIHIVDDDGEEHITHTEVQSGSSDGENDDLWLVTSEGQIWYRRIDGESKTLKIQWSAKVFYGSELHD